MSKLAKAIEATLTGDVKAMRGLNLRYTEVSQQEQYLVNLGSQIYTRG
jgi:hypothetical protein